MRKDLSVSNALRSFCLVLMVKGCISIAPSFSRITQISDQAVENAGMSFKTISKEIVSQVQHQTGSERVNLRFDPKSLAQLDAADVKDLRITNIDVDQSRHRFIATVEISGRLKPVVLRGGFTLSVHLPFVVRSIAPGEIIEESDLEWRMVDATPNLKKAALKPSELIQRTPKQRPLEPGKAIKIQDIQKPVWVRKQEMVQVRYQKKGLEMVQSAKALEDGAQGDRIRVLNPVSRKTISGIVTARKEITVAADS